MPDAGAECTDFVGESNLDGVERVAGVLDHFRGAQRDDGRWEVERLINGGDLFNRGAIRAADNDEGRLHEVFHGSAFAQEFRIGDDLRFAVHGGNDGLFAGAGKTVLRMATMRGLVRPGKFSAISATTRRN
jgi:hypothetical protein